MAKVGTTTVEVDVVIRSITFSGESLSPHLIAYIEKDLTDPGFPYTVRLGDFKVCSTDTIDRAEEVLAQLNAELAK